MMLATWAAARAAFHKVAVQPSLANHASAAVILGGLGAAAGTVLGGAAGAAAAGNGNRRAGALAGALRGGAVGGAHGALYSPGLHFGDLVMNALSVPHPTPEPLDSLQHLVPPAVGALHAAHAGYRAGRRVREKQAAISPQLLGAGLGAAAGMYTAPKDEDGKRQGMLQRGLVGAGVGLGAGHLAAYGVSRYRNPVYGPVAPKPSFGDALRASPLGVAHREGLRAGAASARDSVSAGATRLKDGLVADGRAAVRSVRDTGAAYAADARAIRADPVGAAKQVAHAAVAPTAEMLRSPVATARQGFAKMGPLGQTMFLAGTAPSAVHDFQQKTDEGGRARGLGERTLSAAGRVVTPVAFAAAHPVGGNRITSLLGGQLAEHLTRPALAGTGRAFDSAIAASAR